MRIRESRWALLLCCVLAGLAAVGALAQADDADRELRRALEERFEVLVLRDGLLLQPRDDSAVPRSIEVGPGGVFLDGTPAGEDELEVRLGAEAAELVLRLADLDVDELRRLGPAAADAAAGQGEDREGAEEPEESRAAEETKPETLDEERAVEERAGEARERAERRVRRDTQVVIASGHTVEEDEISEDVVVMGGPLRIHGKVVGDAVAFGGPVTVTGEVTGDVSAIGGPVTLEPTARVQGDVISVGGKVDREPGAEVGGRIEEVPFSWRISGTPWRDGWFGGRERAFEFAPWRHWMRVGWKLVWVCFVALLACVALLVARGPVERMEARVQREPWKAGLVGLLAQVLFLPILLVVVVVLAISIIGIPVLLLLPFVLVAVALAAFLGFVATARVAGRWLARRFGREASGPYVELLVGLVLVYALRLVGHLLNVGPVPLRFLAVMALVLGTLIWYAAWTVGFGAAILTRFGTADSWERGAGGRPLPPAPPTEPERGPESAFDEPEDWSPEETEGARERAEEWGPSGDDEPAR